MSGRQQIASIDLAKFIASFFVIIVHADPLADHVAASTVLRDGISTVWLMFFFIAAGYLFFHRLDSAEAETRNKIALHYVLRILRLWLIWDAVYFPFFLMLHREELFRLDVPVLLSWGRELLLTGSFFHLWFLGALAVGALLTYAVYRLGAPPALAVTVSAALYALCLAWGTYSFLLPADGAARGVYEAYLDIFMTTRNGVLCAPLFLALGWAGIRIAPRFRDQRRNALLFAAAMAVVCVEVLWLQRCGAAIEMYVSLPIASLLLFLLVVNVRLPAGPLWLELRKYSTLIFLIHPIMILGYSVLRGLLGLPGSYLLRYAFVAVSSLAAAAAVVRLQRTKTCAWLKYFY